MDRKPSLEGLTREDYIAIARDIYGRRARGDIEPGLAFFHEDATYRLIGSRSLIHAAGLRVGKDEIREAWRVFDVDFEMLSFEVDDLVVDYPRCSYMSWRMRLRNRGTGAEAELDGDRSPEMAGFQDRRMDALFRYRPGGRARRERRQGRSRLKSRFSRPGLRHAGRLRARLAARIAAWTRGVLFQSWRGFSAIPRDRD